MNLGRYALVIAPILTVGAITACSGRESAEPRAHAVSIANFAFDPSEVVVAPGDTVVWTNADFVPHTATASDSRWDSGSLAANATWRFVAEDRGRYEYYCLLHPTMRGSIVVR